MKVSTITIGYPRIGPNREMKKALELYWSKKSDAATLLKAYKQVAAMSFEDQAVDGVDVIAIGSHTLYDCVLDWAFRFSLIPQRFVSLKEKLNLSKLDQYFAMARGMDDVVALDMTKWFDSNYHNLVPEITPEILSNPPDLSNFEDFISLMQDADTAAQSKGKKLALEVLGPFTLMERSILSSVTPSQFLNYITPLYHALLTSAAVTKNTSEIHFHESAFVLESMHTQEIQNLATKFYGDITFVGSSGAAKSPLPIYIITCYDDLGGAYNWVVNLPGVAGISLDFTRGNNLESLKKHGFPISKRLGCGVLDGRSVWSDSYVAVGLMNDIIKSLNTADGTNDAEREIALHPSCSLMHLPVDVRFEERTRFEGNPRELAFARQKVTELSLLKGKLNGSEDAGVEETQFPDREKINESELTRGAPFLERRKVQLQSLSHQKILSSSIGSFPQTPAMRQVRFAYSRGRVTKEQYQAAVDDYIAYCIGVQDGVGLDVMVHGEPERSDMVEFFAEKLDGFMSTNNGWVQSYGSRYVRPPIIHGDVSKRDEEALTVREYLVAQAHTTKPVKGMLTGPVTILNWSFPRKDISRQAQAYQIARVLRDEVAALEAAGCQIVQVDEPALREGLPLKRARYEAYLDWAIKAFRLSTAVVKNETHIVTHFCYSEFGDIMDAMKNMDADQITIENSRSDNAMVKELLSAGYDHDIAPGVYDVHSPVIPEVEVLEKRLRYFLASGVDIERFWVVPDCGLKTRKWEEVIPSLKNLVRAVDLVRKAVL